MNSQITLCLTIGLRPDLLRKTLTSLSSCWQVGKVIAINDFRDAPTNQAFKEIFPNGHLISLDRQLGHHAAVDQMYRLVDTPYVFHCEDDWLFDQPIDFSGAMRLLNEKSDISQICLRKISDFNFASADKEKITSLHHSGVDYCMLHNLHPQWYGYTFNPHLMKMDLWRELGEYSHFKKERHISRTLRKQGMFTAFLDPGVCHHIGELESVSQPAAGQSNLKKLKGMLKSIFKK